MRLSDHPHRSVRAMLRLRLFGACLALTVGACASGEAGPLVPVEGAPDVTFPGKRGPASSPSGDDHGGGDQAGGGDDGMDSTGGATPAGSDGRLPGESTGTPSVGGSPAGMNDPANGNAGQTAGPTGTTPTCSNPSWSNVALTVDQTGGNLRRLRALVQGGCLFVAVDFDSALTSYALYLDADGNASTGFKEAGFPTRAGADYLLQAGKLYPYAPSGASTQWDDKAARAIQVVTATRSLEFRVPLSMIAVSTSSAEQIWLGVVQRDAQGKASGRIPNTGSFASLSSHVDPGNPAPPDVKCAAVRSWTPPARARSRGMIVPAFGGFEGVTNQSWQRLEDQGFPEPELISGVLRIPGPESWYVSDAEYDWIRLLKAGRVMSQLNLDLWVVVQAANGGGWTSTDLNVARDVWQDVQSSGGRIFGLVQTSRSGSAQLIPASEVMGQVDILLRNYPSLDGIVLDGFSPQFELFGLGAGSTPSGCRSPSPTYPNERCAAPAALRTLDPSRCFDPPASIDPTGGHYHALIGQIRAAHASLIVIGKAAGRLESNQRAYADLVDAFITYDGPYTGASGLSSLLGSGKNEAAWIHGVDYDRLQSTINAAAAGGYSHIYVTHADGYGHVADYFADELRHVIAGVGP